MRFSPLGIVVVMVLGATANADIRGRAIAFDNERPVEGPALADPIVGGAVESLPAEAEDISGSGAGIYQDRYYQGSAPSGAGCGCQGSRASDLWGGFCSGSASGCQTRGHRPLLGGAPCCSNPGAVYCAQPMVFQIPRIDLLGWFRCDCGSSACGGNCGPDRGCGCRTHQFGANLLNLFKCPSCCDNCGQSNCSGCADGATIGGPYEANYEPTAAPQHQINTPVPAEDHAARRGLLPGGWNLLPISFER